MKDNFNNEKTNDKIEINYYDAINKQNIKILVNAETKSFMDENNKYLHDQNCEIKRNECPYNSKTDDPIIGFEDEFENIFENSLEKDLEEVLQETIDQIYQNKEKTEKLKKYFSEHILMFTEKELIVVFLLYYLDFRPKAIAKYLKISKQRMHSLIKQMKEKLAKT
ncbi:MAG: hypothetical protein RR247_04305 [Clostridia bacterium]